jgi:hypothetical protein
MRPIPLLIALLILCLLTSGMPLESPRAIIVILNSEQNRITHFQQARDNDRVGKLREDAERIMQVTINDFTDHFSYCPVYYVMDTNVALLKQRKFYGILLDKQRQPIGRVVLRDFDFYLIAYYGIPESDLEETDNGETIYRARNYPGPGLVILGPEFRRMKNCPYYIYTPDILETEKTGSPKYNYISDDAKIGYKERARLFEDKMKHKIDKYKW